MPKEEDLNNELLSTNQSGVNLNKNVANKKSNIGTKTVHNKSQLAIDDGKPMKHTKPSANIHKKHDDIKSLKKDETKKSSSKKKVETSKQQKKLDSKERSLKNVIRKKKSKKNSKKKTQTKTTNKESSAIKKHNRKSKSKHSKKKNITQTTKSKNIQSCNTCSDENIPDYGYIDEKKCTRRHMVIPQCEYNLDVPAYIPWRHYDFAPKSGLLKKPMKNRILKFSMTKLQPQNVDIKIDRQITQPVLKTEVLYVKQVEKEKHEINNELMKPRLEIIQNDFDSEPRSSDDLKKQIKKAVPWYHNKTIPLKPQPSQNLKIDHLKDFKYKLSRTSIKISNIDVNSISKLSFTSNNSIVNNSISKLLFTSNNSIVKVKSVSKTNNKLKKRANKKVKKAKSSETELFKKMKEAVNKTESINKMNNNHSSKYKNTNMSNTQKSLYSSEEKLNQENNEKEIIQILNIPDERTPKIKNNKKPNKITSNHNSELLKPIDKTKPNKKSILKRLIPNWIRKKTTFKIPIIKKSMQSKQRVSSILSNETRNSNDIRSITSVRFGYGYGYSYSM